MRVTTTPGKKQFTYPEVKSVHVATHFKHKGDANAYHAITALLTITPRDGSDSIVRVVHEGMVRDLNAVTLHQKVETAGAPDYSILLQEDEARVLSEILRMTRLQVGNGTACPELHLVVNELYNQLPHGYGKFVGRVEGNHLVVLENK